MRTNIGFSRRQCLPLRANRRSFDSGTQTRRASAQDDYLKMVAADDSHQDDNLKMLVTEDSYQDDNLEMVVTEDS